MGQIFQRRAGYQLSFDKASCFENVFVLKVLIKEIYGKDSFTFWEFFLCRRLEPDPVIFRVLILNQHYLLKTKKKKAGGSGMGWEFGVNQCKLLHLEQISNEICYTARGTLSSHFWWNMTEDNMRKRMYVTRSLCCTAETDRTL